VVLNSHAERVHQDGDHDAAVKVLAVDDPFQLVPEGPPQQYQAVLGFVRVPAAPLAAPPAAARAQLRPLVEGREVFIVSIITVGGTGGSGSSTFTLLFFAEPLQIKL